MLKYPDRDQCLQILHDTGCSKDVIHHCQVVTEIALAIAKKIPEADIELVEAGGLLHDIGRSRTHGITHAVEGADLARELGLPDELSRIIERHIAAGIPPDTAVELGLPARDYTPRSFEEKIVAHADTLVETHKRVKVERSIEILKNQGLDDAAERVLKLHRELSGIANVDIDQIS
jgi:uncharacterized protein (TIGR00295 family)